MSALIVLRADGHEIIFSPEDRTAKGGALGGSFTGVEISAVGRRSGFQRTYRIEAWPRGVPLAEGVPPPTRDPIVVIATGRMCRRLRHDLAGAARRNRCWPCEQERKRAYLKTPAGRAAHYLGNARYRQTVKGRLATQIGRGAYIERQLEQQIRELIGDTHE